MCSFLLIVAASLCLNVKPAMGVLRGRSLATQASTYDENAGIDSCSSVIAIAMTPDYAYLQQHDMKKGGYEEKFVCELSDGRTIPIQGTDDQRKQLKSLLESGRLVSAESTIDVYANDDVAYLPASSSTIAVKEGVGRKRRPHPRGGRDLASSEELASILVVRVADSNGKVHPDGADIMSDKVFSTHGDHFTLKSQIEACSYGKFEVTHDYNVDISHHMSAPGVIDVQMSLPLLGSDMVQIGTSARSAVEEKLGLQLQGGPFDHVMFVFERCYTDCGWAAYAYVNSYMSVYVGDNYKYVGVQMHEIGHNLNLAHSGEEDDPYSDHTCHMGDPYYSDDDGAMCYNPAKNFQLARGTRGNGWYNDNSNNTLIWNTDTVDQWSGTIIGIADYKNNPNSRPVVVKIESNGPKDLFVGLNRAAGINKDTAEAQDQVTVIEAGNGGVGYAQSFLKATLSQGESYHVPNWRGSGVDMTIHVKEINLNANPGYADVTMSHGIACGNSVCEFGETISNCAYDCSERKLVTTFDYDSQSNGNMFMIKASCDIEVTSLFINSNAQGSDGEVKVYSRKGGYTGHEQSGDGWTVVFSDVVNQLGRGEPTYLGNLLTNVVVQSGQYASFYVVAEHDLVYTKGSQEFSTYKSDNCIEIYEGLANIGLFGAIITPRVWNGIIQYNVISSVKLETTYAYDSGSNGNMFSVKALRDITITSLDINTMARGEGAVRVYTRSGRYAGHEHSSEGWELIYGNSSTQMSGRGQPTSLDNIDVVSVSSGQYQSFYVWAEHGIVYKRGSDEGLPFIVDESLVILEGIGLNRHFGPIMYSPRVWSGGILYKTSSF